MGSPNAIFSIQCAPKDWNSCRVTVHMQSKAGAVHISILNLIFPMNIFIFRLTGSGFWNIFFWFCTMYFKLVLRVCPYFHFLFKMKLTVKFLFGTPLAIWFAVLISWTEFVITVWVSNKSKCFSVHLKFFIFISIFGVRWGGGGLNCSSLNWLLWL